MFKIFALILVLILPISNSFSKDKKSQNITWMSEVYPPYNYKDEDGKTQGIAIELLEATFSHLNMTKTRKDIKIWPWARGYRKAQIPGKLNCIFSTTRTKEREPLFKWFGPISKTTISLFAVSGSSKMVTSDMQLSNYKYAVIRDDIGDLTLRSLGVPDENIVKLSKIEQMIGMTLKGRVDFIAYETNVLNFQAKKLGHEGKFKPIYTIKSSELWFALNKTVSDKTVVRYQKALNAAKRMPAVKKVLKSKYGIILP